ncbi:MAG: hypothetical protein R3F07_11540 [Opitutaceae bacterium]
MTKSRVDPEFPKVSGISIPTHCLPVEETAAAALNVLAGTKVTRESTPGSGLRLCLEDGRWPVLRPGDAMPSGSWLWIRIGADGSGEMTSNVGSFLIAGAAWAERGFEGIDPAALREGVLIESPFELNRPLFDASLNQYWRDGRGFDREAHVRRVAECGFTHLEVNGLASPMAMEETTATEFYPQFYTYAPGLNHFVDTELTRGLWPSHYLEANINRVRKLAALARKYGLKPGLVCFEPRSLPEKFFVRYPTLRGARVDHPFRSRIPRYCLAQDHPVSRRHYRDLIQNMMRQVPDLAYLSVWSNDSGSGFEHTASLYVGRNGGPYMIREWRNHEKIAQVAGESVVRYLHLLRDSAAEINPEFRVLLRIEPFKVEHDTIMKGLGNGVDFEAGSLLVRGYSLPYAHPHYPEQTGIAGMFFQTWMDPKEKEVLASMRSGGVEPVIQYAPGGVWNHEPLLGIPFPRMLHARLKSMAETGIRQVSAFGGLLNTIKAPWWPNAEVIRAFQFERTRPVEDILESCAVRWAGEVFGPTVSRLWAHFEEALGYQPHVFHYTGFGFVWQRTWDRPFVPDIEAIPSKDRAYYERFECVQPNNPAINDFGRDVLFALVEKGPARKQIDAFDRNLFPRVDAVLEETGEALRQAEAADDARAVAVLADLLDRLTAYRCWAMTVRNVCAWVEGVHGYLESDDEVEKQARVKIVQDAIDLELANTRRLLELWESGRTEFMIISDVGENGFVYGENFGELLRKKIALTEQYRHLPPRIDRDIIWRIEPLVTLAGNQETGTRK